VEAQTRTEGLALHSHVASCRGRPRRARAALCLVCAAALLVTASAAWAADAPKTVHVCPSGCDYDSVNAAVNDSSVQPHDTVIVEPGTYTEQVEFAKDITVEGEPGQPRPVITWAADGAITVRAASSGAKLEGLDIEATGSGGTALQLYGTLLDSKVSGDTALGLSGLARRDTIIGRSYGVTTFAGAITDSVVTSSAAGGRAVFVDGGIGDFVVYDTLLRNVTAIASGRGSKALEANYFYSSRVPGQGGIIDARNVIARGVAADVSGDLPPSCPQGTFCRPGTVQIGYSNFRTAAGYVDMTPGHNQWTWADPLLVNPVVGADRDFHETCASPTIDAGTSDRQNGTTDLDGRPRRLGPAPDIGAYERTRHRPLAATGGTTEVSSSTATLHGTVNPRGCPTRYHFQFGRDGFGFPKRTALASAGRGQTAVAVSARLTGLKPGAVYRYRVAATNAAGTRVVAGRSFSTSR
jgi:hypothetical protein